MTTAEPAAPLHPATGDDDEEGIRKDAPDDAWRDRDAAAEAGAEDEAEDAAEEAGSVNEKARRVPG